MNKEKLELYIVTKGNLTLAYTYLLKAYRCQEVECKLFQK